MFSLVQSPVGKGLGRDTMHIVRGRKNKPMTGPNYAKTRGIMCGITGGPDPLVERKTVGPNEKDLGRE